MTESYRGERPFATKSDSSGDTNWFWAILLLAAVLRLFRLGTYPFWHDEVHNLIKANHIGDVLLRGEYVSNHPPLFSVLASGWGLLAVGKPEWFMRLLPALLGILSVAAVYWAGRMVFNRQAGLFAAFLAAISPFFVTHSQDFKEYMILPITGTLAAVALYEAVGKNTVGWWFAYTVSAALACYSESFAGPLLIAINVWYMCQLRHRARTLPGWIASNVTAFALFAPYLPFLLKRADAMLVESDSWWLPAPTPLSVVFYIKTLAFGYSGREPHYEIALVFFVLFFAAGVGFSVAKYRRAATFALCWFAAPIAIVYALSHVIESIFLFRALLPFGIPAFLLVGVAWAQIRPPAGRVAVAVLFALVAVPGLWDHYARNLHPHEFPHRPAIHPPQDFGSAAKIVDRGWRNGDAVVCAAINSWLTIRWYGLDNHPLYFGALDSAFIQHMRAQNVRTSDAPEYDTLLPRMIDGIVPSHDRVWYVYAEWERAYLPGNPTQLWRWLDARYPEVGRWPFLGGELRLYDTSGRPGSSDWVRRVRDNGVVATLERAGETEPYQLVTPDSSLVAQSEVERRGSLDLTLGGDAWAERRSVAQGDSTRLVTFTLMNNSANTVTCDIGAVASDILISAASLSKRDPDSDVWRTMAQHNPEGTPLNYEMPVGVAQFSGPGSASIEGTVDLTPETYDTAVYMLGTPGNSAHDRADVRIELGGVSLLSAKPDSTGEPLRWAWRMGEPVTVSVSSAPLSITAAHTPGLTTSYCDVGHVAFLRRRESRRDRTRAGALFFEAWPGRVQLAPGSSRSWTLEVDDDMGRVDIWAWDRSADGMIYRVFDAVRSSGPEAEE